MSLATLTYNPCRPYLAIPDSVRVLDPSWNSCWDLHQISLIDPNSVLTPGTAFLPVTPHHAPTAAPTNAAAPAASVVNVTPTQTSPPRTYPTSRVTIAQPSPQLSKLSAISTAVDGTSTIYFNPSYLVGTETVVAGGPAVTVDGKTYSLLAGGSSIVIDGSITEAVNSATQVANSAIIPVIQKTWVPAYIIEGQTLVAGGLPITSDGTVLSLQPDGESVVIVVSKTVDMTVLLEGSSIVDASSKGSSISSRWPGQADQTSVSLGPPITDSSGVYGKIRNGGCRKMEITFQTVLLALILGTLGVGASL